MKKASLIINIVLFTVVAVLYILFFTGKNTKTSSGGVATTITELTGNDSTVKQLPIAYVETDSLLQKYEFAKEENEKLISKQESSRLTLAQKTNDFQKDYIDFQKKLENNVYASRERAEQESQRLAKKENDIRALETRLTDELYEQQQKINRQLKDSLNLVLKNYSVEKGFHLILGNSALTQNVLYAADTYNATNDIADILNARYVKKKK